jgi:protein-disulfide isomerase
MKSPLSFAALCVSAALSLPATAQDKSAFTPAQRDELGKFIRDYLVKNPEVLTEAIQALQDKDEAKREDQRKATIAIYKTELYNPAEATYLGNAKGDVTIVEFFDYNCGYCKSMFTTMIDAVNADGEIKWVLKEFPILGPTSVTAAKAALAARRQNKYAEFHRAMITFKGQVNEVSITAVAKNVSMDIAKMQADMKDPEFDKLLDQTREIAKDMGITGTPAILVGDTFVGGAVDKETLKNLIAQARKKG